MARASNQKRAARIAAGEFGAELANGKTMVARNAWTVEPQTAKAEDGTIEVKCESAQVTEQ